MYSSTGENLHSLNSNETQGVIRPTLVGSEEDMEQIQLSKQRREKRSNRSRDFYEIAVKEESASGNNPFIGIKQILDKEQKNEEDLQYLWEFLKEFRFFYEFIDTINLKERMRLIFHLCKKLEYERFEPGSVIMKQGEISNKKIYLILSGRAQVRLQNKNFTKRDEDFPRKLETQRTLNKNNSNIKAHAKYSFSNVNTTSRRGSVSPEMKDSQNLLTPDEHLGVPAKSPNSKTRLRTKTESKKTTYEEPGNMYLDSPGAEEMNEHKLYQLFGKTICELNAGDHFGEQALLSLSKRTTSIIASTNLVLLTFNQQHFQSANRENNEIKQIIAQALLKILPSLDKVENSVVRDHLVAIADVNEFPYGKKLTNEGDIGEDFYFLIQGHCELIKTLIYDKSERLKGINPLYGLTKTVKEEVIISNVEKGTLIGDEIIFDDQGIYRYSIRVSSDTAQFIKFKKNLFLFRCKKEILDDLENYSNKKNLRNIDSLKVKLEKRGAHTNFQELKGIRPVVNLPESVLSYNPNPYLSSKKMVKIRPELKIDIQNFLLVKSPASKIPKSFNNYLESDDKLVAGSATGRNTSSRNLNLRQSLRSSFSQPQIIPIKTPKETSRQNSNEPRVPVLPQVLTGSNTPVSPTISFRRQGSMSPRTKSIGNRKSFNPNQKKSQFEEVSKKQLKSLQVSQLMQKKPVVEIKRGTQWGRLQSYSNTPRVHKEKPTQNLKDFLTSRLTHYKVLVQDHEELEVVDYSKETPRKVNLFVDIGSKKKKIVQSLQLSKSKSC